MRPASVTPEPQQRIKVDFLINRIGIFLASFFTPSTASGHSNPKGSILPPLSSTNLRALKKQMLIRPPGTGKISAPKSLALFIESDSGTPCFVGYETMHFIPGSSLQHAAKPSPSFEIRVSQQPTSLTPSL